jgi:DNA-directed RNA polymerase subunit RPC12/RpoP
MIYFKCSQCKESMEAPASLRGQLLRCPKCGSQQIVKNGHLRKILFILILLLVFFGIYKAGMIMGYERGKEDGASNSYTVGRKEGKDVGYREGYDAALAAGATEDYKNFLKLIDDWLGPGKIDQEHKDQTYAELMKIAKENNQTPADVIATLRAYAQAKINWERDEATFKKECAEEPNMESKVCDDNEIKKEDKTDISEPIQFTPAISKNKDYKPDYGDVEKVSAELDRKEAKKLGLNLEEYRALQRLGFPKGSREFAPETLARNSFYRSLFDVSQGNKRRTGPDAYLTPKEIQGRQKLLIKYKRLAHLQLEKERLEELGQEAEVEKINLKIEKISQNK